MFSLQHSILTYYRLDCSCTAIPAMQWRRVLSNQHPTKHRRFWQWRHLCPDQGSRKLPMGRPWNRLENERIQHVHHVPICRRKQRHSLSTLSLWTQSTSTRLLCGHQPARGLWCRRRHDDCQHPMWKLRWQHRLHEFECIMDPRHRLRISHPI
jgi:hypothetical protein